MIKNQFQLTLFLFSLHSTNLFVKIFFAAGAFEPSISKATLFNGWGIVTATDIPVAWMVSRFVFGEGHPAIDYLLLLAIVDDAIGIATMIQFKTTNDYTD